MHADDARDRKDGARPRLLVVGAGVAGQSLVREIQRDKLPVEPVGFLDDDERLQGTEVCGLPVLGGSEDLVRVAGEVRAQEVLLAIPSAGGRLIRRLVILSRRADLPFLIVPGLRDIILGDVHFSQVRGVEPEHLLGRESVDFKDADARAVVQGRSVLVTGAGGSIGGELCRRLLPLGPRELILLGRGENSLFEIAGDLEPRRGATELVSVIADVRDRARMEVLAGRLRPDLILHAAAHKHVPLMEDNPEEAVAVNVGGTANLIAFARTVGAGRFVLISTDKAVMPASVMGATKKLAEQLVRHAAAQGNGTRFMTVRFGNVLGSRGSVVPFFMSRIRQGLPLPITDPQMTRYFMTMKEAALLVIEAMVLGEPGATYILEMGNPVPILELARNLLVLSGYDPAGGDDGPGIRITGLRPGERLHEVLHEPDEELIASGNPLIRRAEPRREDPGRTAAALPDLLALAASGDVAALRARLADLLDRPALAVRQDGGF
ncbi:MAG: polysaccharide biosynthesis protein [Krumholzibacteria bacterium]|nr:polysaccharide biosynthesis protein [Candidatus Krumholzibacteria bacterium]